MPSGVSALDLYEQATQRVPGKRLPMGDVVNVQPKSAEDLARILTDSANHPSPVRPVGSGSAVTRCSSTANGTLVDMSCLNRVLAMDDESVTVQAGIRLRDLAEHLALDDFELVSGCSDPNRTVGGAISSASLTANQPGDGSQLASTVCQITLINGEGRRVEVSEKLRDLLALVRMSYGLLGIVYAVKLRIRPIRIYSVTNSKVDFAEFVELIPNLMQAQAAVRASLFPFRDRIHVELRYPGDGERKTRAIPWKLRDWATHAALPTVGRTVSKAIPSKNLRGSFMDTIVEASHALNSLSDSGSNAAEQTGRFRALTLDNATPSCSWFFPLKNIAAVVPAFVKFSRGHYQESGFRCDMPANLMRCNQDQSALLSPSYDSDGFILELRSTDVSGWDDFLLEFSALATHFQGVPMFNLTKGYRPGYAAEVYRERLQQFAEMRQRLDPANRLRNQFFAEQIR